MSKVTAKKLYNTQKMTKAEWLLVRKEGIGGSEAASISGLNNWCSPLEVYIDKTDPEVNVVEENEAMEWGNRLEPVVRKKFRELHPEWRVQRSFIMWQHPEHEFMIGNVDSLIFDPKRGWGVHEIKTSSEWRRADWGEQEAPIEYIIQIQHYLAVLGLDWGIYSVLIGGNKYIELFIERDDSIINSLIEIEKDFWFNHVLKKVAPLPDGSDSAERMLELLHPVSSSLPEEEILELDNSFMKLIQEKDDIDKQIKELEKRKKEISQLLQSEIGDYQKAVCGDRKISYKPSRSFNEEELKKSEPNLYEEFSQTVLDKKAFKKAYPKVYDQFMLLKNNKTLTIK